MLDECNQVDTNTTSVTVSWQPSYRGVFYTYSYDNGSIATTSKTSVTITGLTVDTTYTFDVTVHGSNITGNSVICAATTRMSLSDFRSHFCQLLYKSKKPLQFRTVAKSTANYLLLYLYIFLCIYQYKDDVINSD